MQHRSETTRANILREASRLFAQEGYDATGVAEICEAAGVSKGAFYHHFPSKHAVFLALLQSWLGSLDKGMQQIQQEGHDVPQTLMDMSNMVDVVFRAAGGHLPMFLEFWTQASRDREAWQATIAPYHEYQKYFTEIFQRGITEGSIREDVHPDTAARIVISLALGVLLQGLLDPQGSDWPNVAEMGIQYLLQGIAAEAK